MNPYIPPIEQKVPNASAGWWLINIDFEKIEDHKTNNSAGFIGVSSANDKVSEALISW
jgi:hypothetical protein